MFHQLLSAVWITRSLNFSQYLPIKVVNNYFYLFHSLNKCVYRTVSRDPFN